MHDIDHVDNQSAKIRNALVAEPEFLIPGMLGGADNSLNAVSMESP